MVRRCLRCLSKREISGNGKDCGLRNAECNEDLICRSRHEDLVCVSFLGYANWVFRTTRETCTRGGIPFAQPRKLAKIGVPAFAQPRKLATSGRNVAHREPAARALDGRLGHARPFRCRVPDAARLAAGVPGARKVPKCCELGKRRWPGMPFWGDVGIGG